MAEIRPFCGIRYDQSKVGDMAAVICPPYDIITPRMQQELYHQSQYNFVRVEFGRELPQDDDIDNKYTRAAATLEQWLKQEILLTEEKPAVYLHDHYFVYQGQEYRRRGIIVTVRLEEWSEAVIRPHEGTMTQPKGDRLNLLWALQANTSPIFTLFEDIDGQVSSLLVAQERDEPVLEVGSAGGEGHRIRAVTDAGVVREISRYLAGQPLYIADGHHRYESALHYLRERQTCSGELAGNEPYHFVMMTLVPLDDPGLVVLPAHRLVRGMTRITLSELRDKLKVFFDIEELPLPLPHVWEKVDAWRAEETDAVKLVLFGMDRESVYLLTLRDFAAASKMMPYFHSEIYKRLDVSILDHVILEELMGLRRDQEEVSLGYCYDRQEAVNKVREEEYQLAFLLSPVKTAVIKAIADAGDRMPRKSTYFYPKLPSGLLCHRLV